jgi:hypothetical protein
MVAIAKLVCRLQNKKHFRFRVSQQAVPISNRRAQQGAQADAGYSASCFLVSRARRGLALRWPRRKNEKAKNNGAGMAVSKMETRKASK